MTINQTTYKRNCCGKNAIHSLFNTVCICRKCLAIAFGEWNRAEKPTTLTATFLNFFLDILWIYSSTPIILSISRMSKMFSFSVNFRSLTLTPTPSIFDAQ